MSKKLLLISTHLYKRYMSPMLQYLFGHACRFSPTCSEYAQMAFKKYGVIQGGVMSVKRVLRCNPFSKVYFDPLP